MDEMLEIADDSSSDYVEKTGADGKATRVFNKEHFEDRRRRIKARVWTLTHLAPLEMCVRFVPYPMPGRGPGAGGLYCVYVAEPAILLRREQMPQQQMPLLRLNRASDRIAAIQICDEKSGRQLFFESGLPASSK